MGAATHLPVDRPGLPPYGPGFLKVPFLPEGLVVKVVNSLKSAKTRHRDCRVIRRRGRTYVINKTNPRYKARQG